ncbi:MAG: hypothetical protein QOF84_5910 [Streptomyces sp.]|nr:hypothetical protein [Streptomyces sp.]
MHVQIVLFEGFDPLDVIAPYEGLSAGGSASGGAVSVELVSAEGPREVVGGTGGLALDGDTLTGTSKAGRLPASKVTGRRPVRAGVDN